MKRLLKISALFIVVLSLIHGIFSEVGIFHGFVLHPLFILAAMVIVAIADYYWPGKRRD